MGRLKSAFELIVRLLGHLHQPSSRMADRSAHRMVYFLRRCKNHLSASLFPHRPDTLYRALKDASKHFTGPGVVTHPYGLDTQAGSESDGEGVAILLLACSELDVLRQSVNAIAEHTDLAHRLIVVDDCEDGPIGEFLAAYAKENGHCVHMRNPERLGSVAALNGGLEHCSGSTVVVLSAGFVLTPGWLDALIRCVSSAPDIGIAAPLCNLPGEMCVPMNPGDNPFIAAEKMRKVASCTYPDIVCLENVSLLITSETLAAIAPLEERFETVVLALMDGIYRSAENGMRAVWCDDAYVFCPKPVSAFRPGNGRKDLVQFLGRWQTRFKLQSKRNGAKEVVASLRKRYVAQKPRQYLSIADARFRYYGHASEILEDEGLPQAVEEFKKVLRSTPHTPEVAVRPLRVVFIVDTLSGTGGVISIVQLVNDMIMKGIDAKIVVRTCGHLYPPHVLLTEPIFFSNTRQLISRFPESDVVVGTIWTTMYYLVHLYLSHPSFVPAYFVQDYEPLFFPESEVAMRTWVRDTYTLTPYCFAKTPWICEKVREAGGVIAEVPPAIDLDLFCPRPIKSALEKKVVLTMIRPGTSHRGGAVAIDVLRRLWTQHEDVEIHVFGSSSECLERLSLPFPVINHGIVPNQMMPELYLSAYIFLDCSHFHGFGRTIAEAMACGTPSVITDSGGIRSFAIDEKNCLIAPVGDVDALYGALDRILESRELYTRLKRNCRESVKMFDRNHSAEQTIAFMRACVHGGIG